jgi:hypothetical protein
MTATPALHQPCTHPFSHRAVFRTMPAHVNKMETLQPLRGQRESNTSLETPGRLVNFPA